MANYKPIGVPFDRTFRNDLNENFKTLDGVASAAKADTGAAKQAADSAAQSAQKAQAEATSAKQASELAVSKADETQSQLDDIIIESGTSDAEVVQARGGEELLYKRLEKSDMELLENKRYVELKGVNVKQFGAIGDGIADDTNGIQAALDYAKQVGVSRVEIPSGTYKIRGAIKGYSNTSVIGMGSVILDYSHNESFSTREEPFLKYSGQVASAVAISADINYLDTSIAVTDVSGLGAGDLIEISTQNSGRGDGVWDDTSVVVRRGEIVQIKAIDGTTIRLNEPLVDENGYQLTDDVKVKKVLPVENIAVENLTFKGKGRPNSGSGDVGVLFRYGKNIKVRDCRFMDVDKRGIEFISCFNFEAESNELVHPDKGLNDDTNYSLVTTGASRHGRFKNNTMKNARHGITTSHISSAASEFVPGLNRFMIFEANQVFSTWHAGISMHSDVEYVTIQNNNCVSCLYGIESRERNVIIKGNRVVKSKNSAVGIYANKNVKNLIISENTLIGCVLYVTNIDTFRQISSVLISGNIISDVSNQSFALQVEAANGAKLKSVNISGNLITNFIGNGGNSAGMRVLGDVSGVSANNEIRSSTNAMGSRIGLGVNNFFFSNNRVLNSSSFGLSIETGTYKNLYLLNNFFVGYSGGMISGVSNATGSSGNIDGGISPI